MAIIPENTIKIKAPAKINLTLDVTGRRSDGYHNLEMVMQTVSVYDELEVSILPENPRKPVVFNMDKELPDKIPPEKNLVYKAASLMIEKYNIKNSFNIFLKKNIPAAAGLAGGSTDCVTWRRCTILYKKRNNAFTGDRRYTVTSASSWTSMDCTGKSWNCCKHSLCI